MKELYGVTVAMITPFTEKDEVDVPTLETLTETLIEKGVDCLYPCGTTGEMLHLTVNERKLVAETVVKKAAGRVTVFIHAGAATTRDTIELALHAQEIGADGIGVVTPQFFGVSEREMIQYYLDVAHALREDFPIYLYNIPQCSANDLSVAAAQKIAETCSNVVGLKYSWSDMGRTLEYLDLREGNFSVLHGNDKLLIPLLDMGCRGTVSGCANVFPEPFVEAYHAYRAGDMESAKAWQNRSIRCVNLLKAGSNMAYFKEALRIRGLEGGHMRKPQLDLTYEDATQLSSDLKALCKEIGLPVQI